MSRLFPTSEERLLIAEERRQKALNRELSREAHYYARRIRDSLADMGIDHWLRRESRPSVAEALVTGKRARQRIRFLEARYNETAIYLRVDMLHLPYQTMLCDLKNPDVLETLSAACERPVHFRGYPQIDPWNGTWLVIYREGVTSAIPNIFEFKKAEENIPQDAPPLKFCAGIGENLSLLMLDIAKMPHMLVAGATHMGKSTFMNSMLCQLLLRNDPDHLQLVLIDLKGGMELKDYEDIPHLMMHIVTQIEDVEPALSQFKTEMEKRQKMFAGTCRDLAGWNAHHRTNRLPYILLVVDELAQVMKYPETSISQNIEIVLGGILNVSRATGGHVVLCTQRPDVGVVTGWIKANLPARICFRVATQTDSRVVLDTSEAADLTVPGRAFVMDGPPLKEIQTPWISPAMIKDSIEFVKRESQRLKEMKVTPEEIIAYSMQKLNCRFVAKELYDGLDKRISWRALNAVLPELDDQVVRVDDDYYLVRSNGRRELVLIDPPPASFAPRPKSLLHRTQRYLRDIEIIGHYDDIYTSFTPERQDKEQEVKT